MTTISPDSIIDALGGTNSLAARLEVHPSTVSCWRDRGIPSGYWLAISRLAAERRVKGISLEALAELGART